MSWGTAPSLPGLRPSGPGTGYCVPSTVWRASEPERAGFSQEERGGGGGPLTGLSPSAGAWEPSQEALGRWASGLYRDRRALWAHFTVPQGPGPSLTKRITDVQQDESARSRQQTSCPCVGPGRVVCRVSALDGSCVGPGRVRVRQLRSGPAAK